MIALQAAAELGSWAACCLAGLIGSAARRRYRCHRESRVCPHVHPPRQWMRCSEHKHRMESAGCSPLCAAAWTRCCSPARRCSPAALQCTSSWGSQWTASQETWMCLQEKTRCRCAASCSRCASLPQTAPILIVCGGAAQRQAGIVFAGEEALPQWRQLLEVRFFAAHFVAKQSGAQGRIAALWTFCWRGSPAEGGAHPLLLLPAVAAVTVPWHPCKPHKVCRCSLLTQCRGRAAASAPSSSTSVAEQLKSI